MRAIYVSDASGETAPVKPCTSILMHGSEEALAMIVGGLGMGFTLRARWFIASK